MNRLGTETAFEVLAKAQAMEAEGKEIIHLEIGEPDFDTPQHIIDTAVYAINNGNTHYTPSAGMANIRQTFANSKENLKMALERIEAALNKKTLDKDRQ